MSEIIFDASDFVLGFPDSRGDLTEDFDDGRQIVVMRRNQLPKTLVRLSVGLMNEIMYTDGTLIRAEEGP